MTATTDSDRSVTGASPPAVEPSAQVTVRYWAGAQAAAGVSSESFAAGPVGAVLAAVSARHPHAADIFAVCAVLVDGLSATAETPVPPGATVELLPPFAGG